MKCVAVFFVALAAFCSASFPDVKYYGEPVGRFPIGEKHVGVNVPTYYHGVDVLRKDIGEDYYNPYLHKYGHLFGVKHQVPYQYNSLVPSQDIVGSYKPYFYPGYHHSYVVPHLQRYDVPEVITHAVPVSGVPSSILKYVPDVNRHFVPVVGTPSVFNQYFTPTHQDYLHELTTPRYHYGQYPYSSQFQHPYAHSYYGSQYGKVLEGLTHTHLYPTVHHGL